MVFSNKVYDKLKFLAQVVLPGLGTLYATVSGLLAWPNTEEVVGVIMAVDFFLGGLLGLSSNKFNANEDNFDGVVHTAITDEGRQFLLEVADPDVVAGKNAVTLKVAEH